jgi:hypothetical protein
MANDRTLARRQQRAKLHRSLSQRIATLEKERQAALDRIEALQREVEALRAPGGASA